MMCLVLQVDISDETDTSQEIFAGVLVLVHVLMFLSVSRHARSAGARMDGCSLAQEERSS